MMKFDWGYFFEVLPQVASKLNVTLTLTLCAAVFSLLLGLILGLISYHKVVGLNLILKIWVSFMRGTPAVAQLFFFYYGLANVSSLILNMSPVVSVAVIMSLNMSAFISETVRGALMSVDNGQREAAIAFGMSNWQLTYRIVIPQAFRVALPALFNDLINLFKLSSLAFMVGVRDVMGEAKVAGAGSFKFFEIYACVIVIYWIITLILMGIQKILEKKCEKMY